MTKLVLCALSMLAFCVPASAEIFTFEDVSAFTTVPFSVTSGTLTADFLSPQGPVFFVADASAFSSLTGKVLVDSDLAQNELRILFSEPLEALGLPFALNSGQASDALFLHAFSRGRQVGSSFATGRVPGGGFAFPEGTIFFGGAVFDEVRLTSSALNFAIDNVNVSLADTAVPEPSSIWLGGAALTVLALVQRKRLTNN
jgi:hypothetical protein